MTRKQKHSLAIWFIIGGIGIVICAMLYGFEQKFFERGAWWTAIYVGLSLAISAIFCFEHRDDDD